MFLVGLIAGIAAVLALLTVATQIGAYLSLWAVQTLFLLLGVAGGLVMAWAGWQEFQAEGGSFQLGSSGTAASSPTVTRPADPTPSPTVTAPPSAGTGMGSSPPLPPPSTSASDMGSEGGPAARRDDEDSLRNP
jgi:hypothetical protein